MTDQEPARPEIHLPNWVRESPASKGELEYLLLRGLSIACAALYEIKREGKVCKKFDLCDHVACESSMASFVMAQKAWLDISDLGKR